FHPVVVAAAAAMAAEDVEFVDYERDEDDDGMEDEEEDGEVSARALPVPHIAAPAVPRTSRGRFVGRSRSVIASTRDRFDSIPFAGTSAHGGPQRCENPLPDPPPPLFFWGVISRFGVSGRGFPMF
uniref:Uncharacterized protein n=1 Tax=Aegilops tauschii subsp. strangulata TaxID=200361 RepID=A0A453M6K6_AEGTS